MILSVAMFLDWLGEHRRELALSQAGQAMHAAVDLVLANPLTRTRDIGGDMDTKAFTKAIVAALTT